MKVTIIPVTPFQQNSSILQCESTNRAAIVDPGGDLDRIMAQVDTLGVSLEKILVTHAHLRQPARRSPDICRYSSSKKNRSAPKAGFSSSSQVARSSNPAKKGCCVQASLRPLQEA